MPFPYVIPKEEQGKFFFNKVKIANGTELAWMVPEGLASKRQK